MDDPIRVMIVEDNPSVLRLLEVVLSLEPDMDVVGVASGADEALDVAARTSPAVVVLDNQMPGRAGVEIMSELRALGAHGIVVYTAETNLALREKAVEAGVELCEKTGDSQELVAAIRRAAS